MRWEIARCTEGVWATESYSVFWFFFVHVPEVVAAFQRETQQQHFQDISHIMTTVPVSLLLCSRLRKMNQSSFTWETISCRRGLLCLIFSWLQCFNYGGINKLLIEAEWNMLLTVVARTRSWVRPLSLWDASVMELELCYAPVECSEGSVRLASLSLHKVLVKWTELRKGLEFSKLDFFRHFVRFTCESIIFFLNLSFPWFHSQIFMREICWLLIENLVYNEQQSCI